ncbi:MAG: 2,3-dimethylmalate lyase [Alphaproteobacteria bacterium MarineAlpha10_Bin3]|jgi:2-methylisocitrate lyase-like PEP mutase family enzyme|nr:MAG: 2,3-dimethylmalate lyase [Alphaproteobacteria bacterium MarineAlpha10_Bin3]PPR72984.1 MAG: 2,3-dimethylmalate lyase [Alphaproteobacteria bacterium MarineAlpha4_Bin1]
MRKTQRLRQLLAGDGIVLGGGAHDAFSARLVEQAGFELCVVTGAGVAACRGYPDVGLVTLEEMTRNARYIADALAIPVIVDADNGYGNAINVVRTVREFEHAGVAGIHIEDQTWPKRCGHMLGKTVIEKDEMCQKLHAARDAREDPDFVIIARCDAMMVNGLDDVLARGDAYIEAGADMLFCEVRDSMDEVRALASHFKDRVPLHWNYSPSPMVPRLGAKEVEALGYKTCCFYVQSLMAAAKTMQEVLAEIRKTGSAETIEKRMIGFEELWDINDMASIREMERKYAV